MNINGYILCDVLIGDGDILILDAEIDTAYQNSVDDGDLKDSVNLEFEFHEIFVPVGLNAVNAADSSETDESIALVECLSGTLNKLIANAYALAESNKSKLKTQNFDAESSASPVDGEAHQKGLKIKPKLTTRVLGDLFHVMDRVKVPMHHNFEAVHFQDPRAAFFLIDTGDAERVNKFMEQ